MFFEVRCNLPILCLFVASTASISLQKTGWLDRVVQYHKVNFLKDAKRLPAVQIHARIEKAPPGYEDSKDWDFDSVMRLIGLLRGSESGKHVHRALRRMMMVQPNRRLYLSFMDTYKYFPKIQQGNYYDDSDSQSIEMVFETTPGNQLLRDNDVIIVTNPVEARLPSTKISVRMLRAILEERAYAARIMPPTTKPPIEWIPMNKTTGKDDENSTGTADDASTTKGSNDNSTDGATDGATDGTSGTGAESSTADESTKEAGAETTETTTEAVEGGRRHVLKGKHGLRHGKPVSHKLRHDPHKKKPILRQKSKVHTKKPSRKAAPYPRPKVLPWGRRR